MEGTHDVVVRLAVRCPARSIGPVGTTRRRHARQARCGAGRAATAAAPRLDVPSEALGEGPAVASISSWPTAWSSQPHPHQERVRVVVAARSRQSRRYGSRPNHRASDTPRGPRLLVVLLDRGRRRRGVPRRRLTLRFRLPGGSCDHQPDALGCQAHRPGETRRVGHRGPVGEDDLRTSDDDGVEALVDVRAVTRSARTAPDPRAASLQPAARAASPTRSARRRAARGWRPARRPRDRTSRPTRRSWHGSAPRACCDRAR